LERVVFGFILGILVFTATPYLLNVFFHLPLTMNLILILFLMYMISSVIVFYYLWYRLGKPVMTMPWFFTWRNLLLFLLLSFAVFMAFSSASVQ